MNGDDNIGNHLVLGETYKDSRILESLRCVEVVTRPSEDQLSFEDKIFMFCMAVAKKQEEKIEKWGEELLKKISSLQS